MYPLQVRMCFQHLEAARFKSNALEAESTLLPFSSANPQEGTISSTGPIYYFYIL